MNALAGSIHSRDGVGSKVIDPFIDRACIHQQKILLGSVADKLIRGSRLPVLSIRRSGEEGD